MKNKDSKARMQVIFGMLLFAFVMSAELYAMINYSKMYIVIAGLAVVDLICLYVVINGLFALREIKDARSEEQYDSVFKSEKASYLMLKKYFEEIEDKLNYLEKASKVPTEEIVNAQKGIAKVIINRNRENTEALINSNEQVMDQFAQCSSTISEITKLLSEFKGDIISEQRKSEASSMQSIQVKMQDLIIQMKDMELRLNNAIGQAQKVTYQQPLVAAPVYAPQPQIQPEPESAPVTDTAEPKEEKPLDIGNLAEMDETIDNLGELNGELDSLDVDLPEDIALDDSDLDVMNDALADIDIPMEEESQQVEPEVTEAVEPEVIDEPKEEAVKEPAITIETEPVSQEPEVEEAKPAMPDLSDPNKTLSPDEIAALFANMSEDSPKEEPEAVVEPEPIEPEPVADKPPMPDLSDPNKNLSPDEIAALFANMS